MLAECPHHFSLSFTLPGSVLFISITRKGTHEPNN